MKILVLINESSKITEKFSNVSECISFIMSQMEDADLFQTKIICVELDRYGSIAYNNGNEPNIVSYDSYLPDDYKNLLHANKLYRDYFTNIVTKIDTSDKKNAIKLAARKMLVLFMKENDGIMNYATTYGFSFDNFRGQHEDIDKMVEFLDKNNIVYSRRYESWHDEIRISARGKNFENFMKLSEKCWKAYLNRIKPLIDELYSIVDMVDVSVFNSAHPHINSVISIPEVINSKIKDIFVNFKTFNIEREIETLKQLVEVQNDVDKVRDLYFENKSKGLRETNIRLSVYLDAEYERLTGQKLD